MVFTHVGLLSLVAFIFEGWKHKRWITNRGIIICFIISLCEGWSFFECFSGRYQYLVWNISTHYNYIVPSESINSPLFLITEKIPVDFPVFDFIVIEGIQKYSNILKFGGVTKGCEYFLKATVYELYILCCLYHSNCNGFVCNNKKC